MKRQIFAKKKILINGYFFCRKITGIERYSIELTKRLDSLSIPGEISIIIPGDCESFPVYKNISIIPYKKIIKHILWQMIYLQIFLFKHPEFIILDFGNTCLPLFPGIIFLHDIYCEFFPDDFTGIRNGIVRLYNRWQYRLISKKAKLICTVSFFTRNQIALNFSVNPEKIEVIYSSWNHFSSVNADYSIFSIFPDLSKPFFFLLGSLSKRKNIKWIFDYANNNPEQLFAISGMEISTAKISFTGSVPVNIIFLGYLDDSKVKALMEKCKAFLLPSYYEGFGLTPLEALSCGAKVIIANSSSLPEIYGKSAHYIDPFDTKVNLDKILIEPVDPPEEILFKFSYDNSAQKLYSLLKKQFN